MNMQPCYLVSVKAKSMGFGVFAVHVTYNAIAVIKYFLEGTELFMVL